MVQLDLDGAIELPGDRFHLGRHEPAGTGRCEVAGNADNAQPVRPVGGHLEIDYGIGLAEGFGCRGAEGNIAGKVGDAVMVVSGVHLFRGAKHALAFDAAQLAGLLVQRHVEARNIGAERGVDGGHAGAGIGGAANDCLRPVDRIDLANSQPVCVRVRVRGPDLGDGEGRQLCRRISDRFVLQSRLQHFCEDSVEVELCGEIILEPGERELHGLDSRAL